MNDDYFVGRENGHGVAQHVVAVRPVERQVANRDQFAAAKRDERWR